MHVGLAKVAKILAVCLDHLIHSYIVCASIAGRFVTGLQGCACVSEHRYSPMR